MNGSKFAVGSNRWKMMWGKTSRECSRATEKIRNTFFKEQIMSIRKLVIAGFVLATVGLTATVTTVVIGQQPGTTDKNSGAAETAPAAGATTGTTDAPKGSGLVAPPASDD